MKNNREKFRALALFFAAWSSVYGQEFKIAIPKTTKSGPSGMTTHPIAPFEPDWNDPRIAAAMVDDAPPSTLDLDENGIPRGKILSDGDMILPADAEGNVAAAYATNVWPGEVPYVFDANVAAINRTETIVSFQALEAVSDVRFVPRSLEFSYVRIRDSNSDTNPRNSSEVGMQGFEQVFNMSNWNGNTGVNYIIVHEGGHCLGLYHEHQRPDRATFVTINANNVQANAFDNNFPVELFANSYGPYDFDSVMHYGSCAFAIACLPNTNCNCTQAQQTINVNAPFTAQWQANIGQQTHLSYWDGLILSFLYPYWNWRFLSIGGFDLIGSFFIPFGTFATAYNETPVGGTLWILHPSTYAAGPVLDKAMTIGAPLGGVTLMR